MKAENIDLRKNGSGYNDPTAYAVIRKMVTEGEIKKRSRAQDVKDIIYIIRVLLEIIDFEMDGKVIFVDRKTGKKYI